jgi:type IV conjugative transfer system protein TraL
MDKELLQILRYLDEPKRYIGLTLDDLTIGGLTIFFAMVSSHQIIVVLAGLCIRLGVRKILKGNPPSYLLVLMYWFFPHAVTKYFIRDLPPSHKRYWIS